MSLLTKLGLSLMVLGLAIGISGLFAGEAFYEGLMAGLERLGAPDDRDFLPVPDPEARRVGYETLLPVVADEMGRNILGFVGANIFVFGLILMLLKFLGFIARTRIGGLGWDGQTGLIALVLGFIVSFVGGFLGDILYELEPAGLGGNRVYDFLDFQVAPNLDLIGGVILGCGMLLLAIRIIRALAPLVDRVLPAGPDGSSSGSNSSGGGSDASEGTAPTQQSAPSERGAPAAARAAWFRRRGG